jgi:hypothetical protein
VNKKQSDDDKGKAQIALAAAVVIGFFVLLILLFWPANAADRELASARLMMLGALIAGFSTVLGYYFGSTSGSAAKTQLLANSTPTPATPMIVTTTSEQGRVNTSMVNSHLEEIENLAAQLAALQAKGVGTPDEAAEEEYMIRRLAELRDPPANT